MNFKKANNQILNTLSCLDLLKTLSKQQSQYLLDNSELVQCNTREVVYHAGEPAKFVYLVINGSLKIGKNIEDSHIIFDFINKGCLAGNFYFMNDQKIYEYTGIAMEKSLLLAIPRAVFEKLRAEESLFSEKTDKIFHQFVKSLSKDFLLSNQSVAKRLASILVDLYDRQLQSGCYASLVFHLTKQDLADRVRAKPETVIRNCSEWRRQGLVVTRGRSLEILNIDMLRDIAVQAI